MYYHDKKKDLSDRKENRRLSGKKNRSYNTKRNKKNGTLPTVQWIGDQSHHLVRIYIRVKITALLTVQ